MKNAILLKILGFVCTAYLIIACSGKPSGASILYYALKGEDTINLNNDTLCKDTACAYWKVMDSCIFVKGSYPHAVDTFAAEIDTASLRYFYNTYVVPLIGPTGRKVTAMQITFGIDNTNKIILYYQPLCLAYSGTQSVNGITYSCYKSSATSTKYYVYTKGAFSAANYKQKFYWDSARYTDSIEIRHNWAEHISKFYLEGDTEDVHKVIYSFQEIFAVIRDNEPNGNDSLKISNSTVTAQELNSKGVMANYIRHTLLLGPKTLNPVHIVTVKGLYADLGNLCPPDCPSSGVYYIIE